MKENARIQASLLRDTSPVLRDFVKQGKLSVSAGYYDLASSRVSLLSTMFHKYGDIFRASLVAITRQTFFKRTERLCC